MPLRKTIAMIRMLRAAGPLPRRRHMPKQQQPDLIRLEYYKQIMPIVHDSRDVFAHSKPLIFHLLYRERYAQGKFDDKAKDEAIEAVQRAEARAEKAFREDETRRIAGKVAGRTGDWQRDQLDRQVRAAIAIPLTAVEPAIREKIPQFVNRNVDLIKSVHERYFDRIRADVEEAFSTGMHPSTLADLFVERDGMAENDAIRIANDQIGKLNAEFNEARQEAMGVTTYTWETAQDNRVRDEHQDLQGQHFEWDDPPEDGHPGEAVNCRCFASPDFSDILEET